MSKSLNDILSIFIDDERIYVNNEYIVGKIQELALKYDERLVSTLLNNEEMKLHFFKQIGEALIFKREEFVEFIGGKYYLEDSYTKYRNKIGLAVDNNYIKQNRDVVLNWAYKDCVLEGGQDTEDAKQDEVFYNEILASDDIDRLYENKVLTNFKKFDVNGKSQVVQIDNNENLIIKGNNLIALHSIKNKYRKKVKLCLIDVPYNTGNDSFKYNDKFNHSSWLTFIKNRLEVTKELLADDGSIVIYIDDNEIGYLQVLMDEIFGRENRGGIISIKRGSVTGHKTINPGVVNITEYMLVYAKNKSYWNPNKIYRGRDRNERYNNFIKNRNMDTDKWEFCSLLDAFADYKNIEKNKLKKQLGNNFEKEIMEFIKLNADSVIQFAYPDSDKVSKEAKEIINLSKKDKDKIYTLKRENEKDIILKGGQRLLFYSDRLVNIDGELVTGELVSNFWDDVLPNDLHNEGNVKFKKGKKSEKAIKRIIELTTNENDIVLDFFLGSGTTTAVAHKMNRQYIGIEQMNYGENDSVTRMENVIDGESGGISKAVNWQGGGSFVYCELMKWNEVFINKINNATRTDDLVNIWNDMKEKSFLSYRVKVNEIDKNINEFEELSLELQKEFLIEILDKNHLYVNLSEIDDITYNVSDEDKKLNKEFYGLK